MRSLLLAALSIVPALAIGTLSPALAAGISSPALAAGFFYPDLGARALGRGATGAAGAGDLSALEMNPAGLAELTGLRLQLEGSVAWQPIDFTRATACAGKPCATVHSSSGAFLNTISGVSFAARPGLVLALGVYGPPSVGRENFPDPRTAQGSKVAAAPQRYSLISENNLVVYPGLAVAYRVGEYLDVGAVAQLRYFRAQQVQSIYSLGGVGGELTDLDAVVSVDATDSARFVFGAGAILHPLPGLSIGLSARPGAPVHATGTLDVQLPTFAQAAGARVTGNAARIDLNLPPEARLGVRYQRGRAAGEVDVTWENWGVLRSIVVTPVDVVLHQGGQDLPVSPIQVPRRWHAAFTARAGGEFRLPGSLGPLLRLGALYETSAIPDETLQVDFVSLPRLAATAGLSADLGAVSLTAGYAHFFAQGRDVTGSEAVRVNPYPDQPFVIGNGRYQTSLDVFALQLVVNL